MFFLKEKNKKESFFKIPLGIIIGIFFLFFGSKVSFAENVEFSQLISATSTATVVQGESVQQLGLLPSGILLNSFNFAYKSTCVGNCSARFTLISCSIPWVDETCSGNSDGGSAVIVSLNTTSNLDFAYGSFTATTTRNYYYQLRMAVSSQPNGGFYWFGSNNSNAYLNGDYEVFPGASWQSDFSVKDVYFRLGYNLLNPTANNPIVITYPVNNQVVSSLDKWFLVYEFSTSTAFALCNNNFLAGFADFFDNNSNYNCPTSNFSVGVRYASTTNQFNNYSSIGVSTYDIKPIFINSASTTISRSQAISSGDYYAQGILIYTPACSTTPCGTSYIFATSSIISFSVSNSLGQIGFIDNVIEAYKGNDIYGNRDILESTFASTTTACGSAFFQNFTKDCILEISAGVFNGLIFPHNFSINLIQGSLVSFKSVFPFNVFFKFSDTVQSVVASSTNAVGSNLTVHIVTGADVVVLTPTQMQDTIGVNSKNKFFEIQSNIMWIAGGLGFLYLFL